MMIQGIDTLQVCAAISSFAVFAVAVARMFDVRRPCQRSPMCIGKWAVEGGLFLMLAIGVLWWWLDTRAEPLPGEWHLCLIRTAIAGLLVTPVWRTRPERRRITDFAR